MKKEFSPYATFSLEKIEAPKKKAKERKSNVTKSSFDLRSKRRDK